MAGEGEAARNWTGGCLCGHVRFEAFGPAGFPHSCSCSMCRRHSGAPVVAWVEFPREAVHWTGPGGSPALYRSSPGSSRAFCPRCGSSIGAVDDAPVVALLIGSFDNSETPDLAPRSHSFEEERPAWWDGGVFKAQ